MTYQIQVQPSITRLVIETHNNSGKKAAKSVLRLLLQCHAIDAKHSKQIVSSLKSYIS